jgi:hypothetical protein
MQVSNIYLETEWQKSAVSYSVVRNEVFMCVSIINSLNTTGKIDWQDEEIPIKRQLRLKKKNQPLHSRIPQVTHQS